MSKNITSYIMCPSNIYIYIYIYIHKRTLFVGINESEQHKQKSKYHYGRFITTSNYNQFVIKFVVQ